MGDQSGEITRRAAWWWIDRWRKSTAYTDMTLSEQGAYRNLLDELWVRGGVLPNDERILAKISGDALEWPKVRARVMAHFYVAPDGLRNSTHDEVSAESGRRARKQKDWRDRNRTGNADGNAPGNESRNVTPSPGPGPGPSKGKGPGPGPEERTTPADAGPEPKPVGVDAQAAVAYWKLKAQVTPRSAKVLRSYYARAQARLDEGLTVDQLNGAVDGALADDFWRPKARDPVVIWKNYGRVLELEGRATKAQSNDPYAGSAARIRARMEVVGGKG